LQSYDGLLAIAKAVLIRLLIVLWRNYQLFHTPSQREFQ